MLLIFFVLSTIELVLPINVPVWELEVKTWKLVNQNGSITLSNIKLPSGVYTALNTEDPDKVLKSFNDVNMRWIAQDNWTYTSIVESPQNFQTRKFVNLTFHGIDTISTIKLNGKLLGVTNNMFVRYSYNVKDLLNESENILEVILKSPITEAKNLASKYSFTPPEHPPKRYHGESHMNFLRKMQASFGWDWGLAAPSIGIWKPVWFEIHDVAIIRDIDVIVIDEGDRWKLRIKVFLETGLQRPFYGKLTIYAVDILEKPIKITREKEPISHVNPVIEFDQNVPKEQVELWWPNGYGKQKLYHLHFEWNGKLSKDSDETLYSISQKSIRIGFRTVELIQNPIEKGDSFYFRINGIPMFMKGSNWIPSHILPENLNDQARIKHLLYAAKSAHINMLRVWGGGIYESDYFYDLADEYGILIWQDMMFACAMYPVYLEFLESVREEVKQNIKRIAYHPSIAIWAANNENEVAIAQDWYKTKNEYDRFAHEYRQLYVNTILKEFDIIHHSSRPISLSSSPSNGKKTISENYLSTNPQDWYYGDIHYYNYLANAWNPNIYPKPRFASEYGFQSLPAITSWEKIMNTEDNLSDLLEHRQHLPLGYAPIKLLINMNLELPKQNTTNYYEALIYFSQITQAMATKTETEVYRTLRNTSYNTMGALYWQLNDVWIAPSWSSIDFYGNYKLLHYWAYDFLAPITIIAHQDLLNNINVYVTRDTIDDEIMDLSGTLKVYKWSELASETIQRWNIQIEPNTAKLVKTFKLDEILIDPYTKNNCFLEFSISNEEGVISTTHVFPDKIKNAVGIQNPLINIEVMDSVCQQKLNIASILIKIQYPAIFVYLEFIRKTVDSYTFSKNGYIQVNPIETIHLEFISEECNSIKPDEIKILTINQFMSSYGKT